jgi:hypothetical protein
MTKSIFLRRIRLPLLAAVLALAACDDPFANQPWNAVPDTVSLYSAGRIEYAGMPSALSLAGNSIGIVAIDQTGGAGEWDFLLNEEEGELLLVPSSIVPGLESRAGIVRSDASTLEEVERAPESGAFSMEAEALIEGAIYILRSRRSNTCIARGSNYAKIEVVDLDEARGIATIAIVRNPYCDDRDLIPPDDD